MPYRSTKTWSHLASAAFRQHRATSHCRFVHGYALSFTFVYEAEELDDRNWVVDFGLKSLKEVLNEQFDHKLLVARDDPALSELMNLDREGVAEVRVVGATGCERFAELAYQLAAKELKRQGLESRVRVLSATVSEHEANSATFIPIDGVPYVR